MGNFADLVAQDIRLTILRALQQDAGYSLNEHLLRRMLGLVGHEIGGDRLRTEMAWLAEQGLVSVEEVSGLRVAKLNQRGEDVALGRSQVPGVQRPRPE